MSFHPSTKKLVKQACDFELEQAKEAHGLKYHSKHEAWAVLKEEVEEVEFNFNNVKDQSRMLWNAIKKNNGECSSYTIKEIQENAILAMMELSQVWAVCEKMKGE